MKTLSFSPAPASTIGYQTRPKLIATRKKTYMQQHRNYRSTPCPRLKFAYMFLISSSMAAKTDAVKVA
jgi:hypothetical protein